MASSKDLSVSVLTLYLINVFCTQKLIIYGVYDKAYRFEIIVSLKINCSFVTMLTMFRRLAASMTFVTDWTLRPRQQQWKPLPQPRPSTTKCKYLICYLHCINKAHRVTMFLVLDNSRKIYMYNWLCPSKIHT